MFVTGVILLITGEFIDDTTRGLVIAGWIVFEIYFLLVLVNEVWTLFNIYDFLLLFVMEGWTVFNVVVVMIFIFAFVYAFVDKFISLLGWISVFLALYEIVLMLEVLIIVVVWELGVVIVLVFGCVAILSELEEDEFIIVVELIFEFGKEIIFVEAIALLLAVVADTIGLLWEGLKFDK